MRSRRSFFANLVAAAAVVAIAPKIAFGKLEPERVDDWRRKFIEQMFWGDSEPGHLNWRKVPFFYDTIVTEYRYSPEYLEAINRVLEAR